jgi:hypothetical protein
MKVSKAGVAPRTSVSPRAMVPSVTAVSRTAVTASRAGVLKISTGAKRPAAAPSPMAKGKRVKVDVRPPPASVASHVVLVRPRIVMRADDDPVAYCAILDSVLSAESSPSSLKDSSSSESIMALPPLIPDLHIFAKLSTYDKVAGVRGGRTRGTC